MAQFDPPPTNIVIAKQPYSLFALWLVYLLYNRLWSERRLEIMTNTRWLKCICSKGPLSTNSLYPKGSSTCLEINPSLTYCLLAVILR